MGLSENDLKIVTLTKFKKMSSTQDLHKDVSPTDEDPSSGDIECCFNESTNGSKSDKLSVATETCADVLGTAGDVNDNCCCKKPDEEVHNNTNNESCLDLKKTRTRRKSWCVESSMKKQFNRNSEIRRTLERSEGLPPLQESQSSSPAFVSGSSRLAGLIDQRLKRLRISSKAMTLAVPSERRRNRPSLFDYGRRKSETGAPLTLAGLKARRKNEGLSFEGLKFFPDKLKSSKNITNGVCNEKTVNKKGQSMVNSKCQGVESPSPVISNPSPDVKNRDESFNFINNSSKESTDEVVPEVLCFNSRNILESSIMVTPPSNLSKITINSSIVSDHVDSKFESEKSLSLLPGEEDIEVCSEASEDTQDLAKNLRRHITSFADRLHLTKDRLEDTAKCYLLLDKAYEWALEAMKVVGRVKSSGPATPEQVGAAADAIGDLLHENPPVSEETFNAMLDLATKLDNQTLLQQCKMAHARCKETISLLRNRQSALLKARLQMEFDCQSFVNLNEILSVPEENSYLPPSFWSSNISHNNICKIRSNGSLGSRPRDPVSRCSSIETDDESVYSESPFSSTPSKVPLECKNSLRGIKELRESDENLLRGTTAFVRDSSNYFRSSLGSDLRMNHNDSSLLGTSPSTINSVSGTTVRAFSSGSSSSCSSSESSGPTTGHKKDRCSLWRYSDFSPISIDESTDLEDRINISTGTNSHLLIRGSQINLSNSEDLTEEEVRRNKTLLLIMQELIQTERDYVNSLEYIIENFLPELLREDIPQALRGQRNVIFGNIEKIYEFHSSYFLKALESCRTRPFAVGSIFLRYENQFYLYALYNKNKPKSDELMADFGSNFFKQKQMTIGDKMDLSSYLLKPVQRMGKYALLLKQLLKECSKNEEGHDELKMAQEMVQFQLRHGNDLLAMDSLRDCDVNLKEQGRLLRQGEFLVTEGSRGKKSMRHVFLFEDLILFSKSRKDPEKKNLDIFQYKQSLKTTDIGLTAQVGESPLRFEIWFRKRKPSDTFLFQSPSIEVKEAWTEEISKLLWRQALRNRKLRLHEMSSMGIGNKPCLDIRPSEDQISDRSVSINKAPPRLRLSNSSSLGDATSGVRRPHSVISVSSSASSAESSTHSSAGPSFVGTLNLGFESGDSPKPLQRSVTRTSQCSAESGIITDIFPEREPEENHIKIERSNSTATNTSVDSALSPSTLLSQTPSSVFLTPLEEPLNTELHLDVKSVDKGKALLTTEV